MGKLKYPRVYNFGMPEQYEVWTFYSPIVFQAFNWPHAPHLTYDEQQEHNAIITSWVKMINPKSERGFFTRLHRYCGGEVAHKAVCAITNEYTDCDTIIFIPVLGSKKA